MLKFTKTKTFYPRWKASFYFSKGRFEMDIQNLFANRIGGKEFGIKNDVYKFALIKQWKKDAQEKFPNDFPLIDMGVGEPDVGADLSIVNVLATEAAKSENRFYADNGIEEFQCAAVAYLHSVFGVTGLSAKNVIHGIGSKPILSMLPKCFINEGDYLLQTVPGYTVMATHTKYLGGKVFNLPLSESNYFYPDFSLIPDDVLKRAKLLYINYPNNPTGQVATKEFFEQVVAFAKANNIIVVHDAAYAALTYNSIKPLSFLSIDGALDVGVEIHSLSKSFNMTGWRLGFIAGNEKVIAAYGVIKDNTDSGQFRAIQKAGIYALEHTKITEDTVRKYSRRFDLLIGTLQSIGFQCNKPNGTFYCYTKIPYGTSDGIVFKNALEAAQYILLNANVSVVPWDDCGSYLRFSVTFSAETVEEEFFIVKELETRLKKLNFIWK